jgi:hypothetical protein
MLLRRDALITKEDHEVLGKGAVYLVHLAVRTVVADELAEIDPGNLGADDRSQLLHADRFVGFRFAGRVTIARA